MSITASPVPDTTNAASAIARMAQQIRCPLAAYSVSLVDTVRVEEPRYKARSIRFPARAANLRALSTSRCLDVLLSCAAAVDSQATCHSFLDSLISCQVVAMLSCASAWWN